jgi:hypothetical protein
MTSFIILLVSITNKSSLIYLENYSDYVVIWIHLAKARLHFLITSSTTRPNLPSKISCFFCLRVSTINWCHHLRITTNQCRQWNTKSLFSYCLKIYIMILIHRYIICRTISIVTCNCILNIFSCSSIIGFSLLDISYRESGVFGPYWKFL